MTTDVYTITPAIQDDMAEDNQPPIDGVEYPCVVCGKEAGPYSGRGRKPTKCPEHKAGNARTNAGSKSSRVVRNRGQAELAARVLVTGNAMVGMGLIAVGMYDTQKAISEREEIFYAAAVDALETDPELCKIILKGGAMSGRAALIVAYGMLAVGVFPVARMEFSAMMEARKSVES